MAKMTGLNSTVTVDDASGTGRDISNDINSLTFSTPKGAQDVTGVDKSAMERLLLLADGNVSFTGTFNTASNMSHDVFKSVSSGTNPSRTVVILLNGAATLTMEILFTDYQVTRGADGSLTWTAPGVLANGVAPAWS